MDVKISVRSKGDGKRLDILTSNSGSYHFSNKYLYLYYMIICAST